LSTIAATQQAALHNASATTSSIGTDSYPAVSLSLAQTFTAEKRAMFEAEMFHLDPALVLFATAVVNLIATLAKSFPQPLSKKT
jgi:hypothetical protein